jgi:hypothetical protein
LASVFDALEKQHWGLVVKAKLRNRYGLSEPLRGFWDLEFKDLTRFKPLIRTVSIKFKLDGAF